MILKLILNSIKGMDPFTYPALVPELRRKEEMDACLYLSPPSVPLCQEKEDLLSPVGPGGGTY